MGAGKEAVAYMGPKPTIGIHRYILVLFQQKKPIGELQPPVTTRTNFCTRAFAHHLDLHLPVATVYFNAHKEPASSRRRSWKSPSPLNHQVKPSSSTTRCIVLHVTLYTRVSLNVGVICYNKVDNQKKHCCTYWIVLVVLRYDIVV